MPGLVVGYGDLTAEETWPEGPKTAAICCPSGR